MYACLCTCLHDVRADAACEVLKLIPDVFLNHLLSRGLSLNLGLPDS